MKKLLLVSAAISALLLAGCAPRANTSVESSSSASGTGGASGGSDVFGSLSSGLGKIYFDFDRYDIKPEMQSVVNAGANLLKGQASSAKITIEGHCDEWGSDEYNQALGLRRANSVKRALTTLGLDSKQIAVKSLGESAPACTTSPGDRGQCDAQNRRAEIKVGL